MATIRIDYKGEAAQLAVSIDNAEDVNYGQRELILSVLKALGYHRALREEEQP